MLKLAMDQEFRVFENIDATPDLLLSLALLRDEQRLSLGEFVDGSYHLAWTINKTYINA